MTGEITHRYVEVVLPEIRLDHVRHVEAVGHSLVGEAGVQDVVVAGVQDVVVVAGVQDVVVVAAGVQDVGEVVALSELANLYLEKSW